MPRLHCQLIRFVLLAVILVAGGDSHAAQVFSELDQGKLRQSLSAYMGTRYLYGGTSRSGIDCSGLMLALYREQGIELPRTAQEQYRVGRSVTRDRLQVGDLVFFNTTGRGVSHVGIVNALGTFVHASTSRGVVADEISDDFWRRRYIGARRIASTSTYVVSGDRVGAAASDRVAVADRYPFIEYELIDIPTHQVSSAHTSSIQFRTNIEGDVIIHPQISFWQRVQVAGYLRIGEVLGSGSPDVSWPDLLVKFRINDQWSHLPGFAVGLDTRVHRIKREIAAIDTLTTTRRRWLFLVGSGTLLYNRGFFVGQTRFHAGGNLHALRNIKWGDDVSAFCGIEQQLFRRMTLMAELDNIFGRGGWHANVGARLSITDDAVIEYDMVYMGKSNTKIDKVLKFSFNVPY